MCVALAIGFFETRAARVLFSSVVGLPERVSLSLSLFLFFAPPFLYPLCNNNASVSTKGLVTTNPIKFPSFCRH